MWAEELVEEVEEVVVVELRACGRVLQILEQTLDVSSRCCWAGA